MGAIVIHLNNEEVIFTDWYQNTSDNCIRACGITGSIIIVPALYDFYVPIFNYDPRIMAWGNHYYKIYKNEVLTDLQATKNRVDEFLINTVPRINKLLVFL